MHWHIWTWKHKLFTVKHEIKLELSEVYSLEKLSQISCCGWFLFSAKCSCVCERPFAWIWWCIYMCQLFSLNNSFSLMLLIVKTHVFYLPLSLSFEWSKHYTACFFKVLSTRDISTNVSLVSPKYKTMLSLNAPLACIKCSPYLPSQNLREK